MERYMNMRRSASFLKFAATIFAKFVTGALVRSLFMSRKDSWLRARPTIYLSCAGAVRRQSRAALQDACF